MDTSGLESFAQNLRVDLLDGVKQRLRYWGFKEDGTVAAEPEDVEGGYLFRGEVLGYFKGGFAPLLEALVDAVGRENVTTNARVTALETVDGEVHVAEMHEAPGSPSNPVADGRLRAKFLACVEARFDRDRADALADGVERLDERALSAFAERLRGS